MKNLSLAINAVLVIAVAVLFYLHFKDCKKATGYLPTPPANAGTNPIAYVDIDTLEVYYNYYKVKKAELEKNQSSLESSLKAKATRLQNDYLNLQQRAQAGTLTQSEGEAAQTDLQNRGAQLEQERDNSAAQIQTEMASLLKEINGKIDTVIRDINKDKKYTYVISYSSATSLILYKDQALDITRPVLDALNAKDENNKK
ncbi:MAG: OmpH family outer membrane protein [Bacteroidetes bacterium]|nr:OmpH family outer membrane protein [Bacteroidota bacterium]